MSIAAKVIKLEVYLEDANLYVAEDIEAGGIITEQNVRSVRLGYGLHTKYLKDVIGKKAQTTIKLRRRFKTKTLDAIIAATALLNNMSVVTNNHSDFEALGLDVIGINVNQMVFDRKLSLSPDPLSLFEIK